MGHVRVHVLGVSHDLQCGTKDVLEDDLLAYRNDLTMFVAKHSAQRIVEEISADGLDQYGVSCTIAQEVARASDITYQPVDLNRAERAALSLDDSAMCPMLQNLDSLEVGGWKARFDDLVHEARERVWIARTLSVSEWPALFICGSDHVAPVCRLWRRLGISVVAWDRHPSA